MKQAPKETFPVAARKAKRVIENLLTEAKKYLRLQKIRVTADANINRRDLSGVGGLFAEATRKTSRRKSHPMTDKHRAENW